MSTTSMRRVLALLATFALVLAGCTASASTSTSIGVATATPTSLASPSATAISIAWERYADASYGFSLDVPTGWAIHFNTSGYYLVQIQDEDPHPAISTYAALGISVTDVPGLISNTEAAYCSGAKTATVGGYPAVADDKDAPTKGVSGGAQLRRYFVANGLFYEILLWGTASLDLDQLRAVWDASYAHMLASFQAGPGKPGNVICLTA